MGYLFLVLTILSETTAVILMKFSAGFQHTLYTIFAIIAYAGSFVFLTLSLKSMPAGLANGIWAASSAILVALLGIFFFKEKLTSLQIISIALIAAGLVGLNYKASVN